MQRILLSDLLDRIDCADSKEISSILNAVTERFSELNPGWELFTLTFHGHGVKDRTDALQKSLAFLSQCAENDLP